MYVCGCQYKYMHVYTYYNTYHIHSQLLFTISTFVHTSFAYYTLYTHTYSYTHYTIYTYTYSDYLPKLGLREGWKDALQSLAQKNVPTFLFSSGYGDIVQQVSYSGVLY